ncbi:hypothetical protein SNK05_008906 [Fusarium graminearum]
MAGHGHHSFNGPPKPPVAHVPRIYRFTATALGAGMWFFLMYRAKKDGMSYTSRHAKNWLSESQWLTSSRCRSPRPQAPLGPLNEYHQRLLLFFRNSYNREGISRRNQRIRGLDAVYIEQKRL